MDYNKLYQEKLAQLQELKQQHVGSTVTIDWRKNVNGNKCAVNDKTLIVKDVRLFGGGEFMLIFDSGNPPASIERIK